MATVTGMTAAAMQAIRDGMVVNATIDSANHLKLIKYDGTQIDAGTMGASTTGQSGLVELATNAETQAGTDAVRAVTPAGLASIPGNKVQILSVVPAESATPASYPLGISHMVLSGSESWSINSSVGSVITNNPATDRTQQTFFSNPGGTGNPRAWVRYYHSTNNGGGWTSWRQQMIMNELSAASFSQSTAPSSYPSGISRIYFTSGTSTGWDFAGTAGEVRTWSDTANDYYEQTFTSHVSGTSKPVRWFRTANTASGWTAWQATFTDPGVWSTWTPSWTTASGIHLPSFGNATLDCRYVKMGRTVTGKFDIVFGSTTNFGATPATSDNWVFGLPVAAARTSDTIGFVHMQQSNSLTVTGRIKVNSSSGSFLLSIAGGTANATAIANNGDVDSLSPWTWASGDYVRGTFVYESAA